MPTFEIDCVDTATFKVYSIEIVAATLAEVREVAIRSGHKLSASAQSLNPQLVPPSVQMSIPESGDEETGAIAPRRKRDGPGVVVALLAIAIVAMCGIALMRFLR